jgi:hypothetical protein
MDSISNLGLTLEESIGELQMELNILKALVREQEKICELLDQDLIKLHEELIVDSNA